MAQDTCSVDGCDRSAAARGWCIKHYNRWHRNGDPVRPAPPRQDPPMVRFWSFVDRRGPEECWLWTGSKAAGYGRFTFGSPRRTFQAHRLSYEELVGPIPEGLHLDHLCRNPPCVNPAHLEPVTNAENLRRGAAARPARTHCAQGHPLSGANRYVRPAGKVECRICRSERAARDYRRRLAPSRVAVQETEDP